MKRIFTLLIFSVSLFLAFSCNSSTTESQVVASEIQEELISKNISAQEFQRLIKDRKEAIILDVRTADEVAEGTIGQAKHLDFYGENFVVYSSNYSYEIYIFIARSVNNRLLKSPFY